MDIRDAPIIDEEYLLRTTKSARLEDIVDVDLSGRLLEKLDGLQECTQLRRIDASSNNITYVDLRANRALREIRLYNNRLEVLHGFDGLPDVEVLYAHDNFITAITGLNSMRNLTNLNLSYNRIVRIDNLAKCKELNQLALVGNRISRIENLDSNIKLQELDLRQNGIRKIEGISNLADLRELMLSDNVVETLEGLRNLKMLNNLWVANNQIRDLSTLPHLAFLLELNVAGNSLRSLRPIMDCCPSLQVLDARDNHIDDADEVIVLRALRLFTLRISGNPACSESLTDALVTALPRLQYLDGMEVQPLRAARLAAAAAKMEEAPAVDVEVEAEPIMADEDAASNQEEEEYALSAEEIAALKAKYNIKSDFTAMRRVSRPSSAASDRSRPDDASDAISDAGSDVAASPRNSLPAPSPRAAVTRDTTGAPRPTSAKSTARPASAPTKDPAAPAPPRQMLRPPSPKEVQSRVTLIETDNLLNEQSVKLGNMASNIAGIFEDVNKLLHRIRPDHKLESMATPREVITPARDAPVSVLEIFDVGNAVGNTQLLRDSLRYGQLVEEREAPQARGRTLQAAVERAPRLNRQGSRETQVGGGGISGGAREVASGVNNRVRAAPGKNPAAARATVAPMLDRRAADSPAGRGAKSVARPASGGSDMSGRLSPSNDSVISSASSRASSREAARAPNLDRRAAAARAPPPRSTPTAQPVRGVARPTPSASTRQSPAPAAKVAAKRAAGIATSSAAASSTGSTETPPRPGSARRRMMEAREFSQVYDNELR